MLCNKHTKMQGRLIYIIKLIQVSNTKTVFIINFEHILHLFKIFLSLNLNKKMLLGRYFAFNYLHSDGGIIRFILSQNNFLTERFIKYVLKKTYQSLISNLNCKIVRTFLCIYPANLVKANNRHAKKRCEICSKLIKTPQKLH